jgi:hypothetical protein
MTPVDRPVILHVGTHKTATTSLQLFLEENRALLAQAGLLLPMAGRPPAMQWGNHRLAWELLAFGSSDDLPALAAELRAQMPPAALLTSEDFSLLCTRPDTLASMASTLRAEGYLPKVIIYVRPQAPYIESMYVERIKHDQIRPLDEYLDEIYATGQYHPAGTAIRIEFRYSGLLEPFVEIFGRENVAIKVYQSGAPTAQIFQEFLALIAWAYPQFAQTPLDLQVRSPRANESLRILELVQTVYGKLEKRAPDGDLLRAELIALTAKLPESIAHAKVTLLTRDDYLRCIACFGDDNAKVNERYGIAIPFVDERDVPPAGDPQWELARVQRAYFDEALSRCLEAASRG